jgi:septum formation protein
MPLILGSQSPRREEILRFFSIPFKQVSSPFDERTIHFEGDPKKYVETLAIKKGESLSPLYPDDPIIAADTIVFHNKTLYNKPLDRQEATKFLKTLQGSWHSVFTSVALFYQGKKEVLTEETRLLFRPLSSLQIDAYLSHINFLDKAGGYALQQGGGILVEKIEGSHYNVMGLPLAPLETLLSLAGIDLWSHLKIL